LFVRVEKNKRQGRVF